MQPESLKMMPERNGQCEYDAFGDDLPFSTDTPGAVVGLPAPVSAEYLDVIGELYLRGAEGAD